MGEHVLGRMCPQEEEASTDGAAKPLAYESSRRGPSRPIGSSVRWRLTNPLLLSLKRQPSALTETSNTIFPASPQRTTRWVQHPRRYLILASQAFLLYLVLRGFFPDTFRAVERTAVLNTTKYLESEFGRGLREDATQRKLLDSLGERVVGMLEVFHRATNGASEDASALIGDDEKHSMASSNARVDSSTTMSDSHWLRDILDHSLGWQPIHD